MIEIKGSEGAVGYAVGKVVILKEQKYTAEIRTVKNPEEELKRLEKARDDYRRELEEVWEETKINAGADSAAILQAYKEMVNDEIFFQRPIRRVREERINIELALEEEKKKEPAKVPVKSKSKRNTRKSTGTTSSTRKSK